ncbi:MAG: leucine-rich repeat domain-containing protein [Candidatus Thorarchaeota archaeon]
MQNELLLVVRCAKAPNRNYHFIFKTPADEGSEFFLRKSNLKWVEDISNPIRIDISGNWLTDIDLSPLESCESLEYLSVAVNKLETIDLTPLQNLKNLRHLDLSHNRFKEVDLTPLAGCENLVYLYLQENSFPKINIAPLMQLKQLSSAVLQLRHRGQRPKLVIDSFMSNVPPNLNDRLFAFFTDYRAGKVPEWLYDKNTEIRYSPRSYRELVTEFGWAEVKKHLVALSKKLRIGVEFEAQKIILDAFGMPELACYDGRVRDIVKLLLKDGSYDNGIQHLYTEMIHLLDAQLRRGGSTLYFDLNALSTTPGSVLIPSVLSRRPAEIQEVTLFDRSGRVDLFPLWLTSYGNKILTAMGVKRYVSKDQLSEINKALEEIDQDLTIERVVYDARKNKTQRYSTGEAILSHLRQTVAT